MYKIVLIILFVLNLSRLKAEDIQIVSDSVCFGDSTHLSISTSMADTLLLDFDWDLDNDGFYDDAHGRYIMSLFPAGTSEIGVQLTTKDRKTYFSEYAQIVVFEKPKSGFYTKNLCQGKEAVLTCDSANYIVTWAFDNNSKNIAEGVQTRYIFSEAGNHLVSMKMTDQNGCKNSIQKTITINELPFMQLKTENAGCYTIKFTGTEGSNTIIWLFGDSTLELNKNTTQHTYSQDGIYYLKEILVTDKGCRDTLTGDVFLPPKPDVSIHPEKDTIDENTSIVLQALTINTGASYHWSTGSQTDTTVISSPGTYSVIASNASGCDDTASVTIYLKQKPIIPETNADILLTPNNDGINDLLAIPGWETCTDCNLAVFSVNGKMLFKKDSYLGDWDGQIHGKTINPGAYYYILTKGSKVVIKGSVNVLK